MTRVKSYSPGRIRFMIFVSVLLLITAGLLFRLSRINPVTFNKQVEDTRQRIVELRKNTTEDIFDKRIGEVVATKFNFFHETTFAKSLLEHLSVGFLVAVVLIITVEAHARARFQREAGEDVLFAVLRKQIPEPVFIEIQEHVLREPFYRKNWIYDFTFKGRPYDGLAENLIVIEYSIGWTIKNTSSESRKYKPLFSLFNHPRAIVSDNEGTQIHLSRFRGIWIGNAPLLKLDEILKQENSQRENELIVLDVKPIVLRAGEEKRIVMEREEVAYHPCVDTWSMAGYGEDLKIAIHNEAKALIKDIKVDFIHPRKENLEFQPGTRDWIYEGGLLPNQGIRLSWEAVGDPEKINQ